MSLTPFAQSIYKMKYSLNGLEEWIDTADRVVLTICNLYPNFFTPSETRELQFYVRGRLFIPAGRYLYSTGRELNQVKNCFAFRAEDTREGWAKLFHDVASTLMTGGGLGVDYSDIRPKGSPLKRTGGYCSGPLSLMRGIDAIGQEIIQGGFRRSALLAFLKWNHPDIQEFIQAKQVDGALSCTNISVYFDDEFIRLLNEEDVNAKELWRQVGLNAFKHAEPGFKFPNFHKPDAYLTNACGEFLSETSGDSCNLGTIFIDKVPSITQFKRIVYLATKFLIAGNHYSYMPSPELKEISLTNMRVGLGLGGFSNWLIKRGLPYKVNDELEEWLDIYKTHSEFAAQDLETDCASLRAIAPNGTIGIIAESSTGIEPIFCKAYKRRYKTENSDKMHYQYVVDGGVKQLLEQGINPAQIWDASDLTFEDRIKFQADVQPYVDNAISSTVNLASWGSPSNNENNLQEKLDLIFKLVKSKKLKGLTVYSDGCKAGQPLTRVPLHTALSKEGLVFEESLTECIGGVCGI
jgi:ribonucleoside-diphosphate reductase alpha chain